MDLTLAPIAVEIFLCRGWAQKIVTYSAKKLLKDRHPKTKLKEISCFPQKLKQDPYSGYPPVWI